MIYFLILLNILVAWWNCYSVAQFWNAPTTGFESALKWSAVIQSIAGFSIPFVMILTWIVTMISPDMAAIVWENVMRLWYIAVIVPVLGSGFIIWAHSVREAIRERSVMNIGIATYNTVAQASNTFSFLSNIGNIVGELFEDAEGMAFGIILLIALIVVVGLFASAFFTLWLIRHHASRVALA